MAQYRDMCWPVVDCTDLAQHKDMCWAFIKLVVKLWFPVADNFLPS